jgi:ketosteroid isomerase-like protein
MPVRFLAVCLSICLGPVILIAQDTKVDLKAQEAAIRAILASHKIPYTDDNVDWIGRYKRPTVGKELGEQFPDSDVAKRKNAVYTTKKIERLEIAAAGDMAWEFSINHAEYDVDETPARHESFDTGQLRVWKNVHGQWKVAARFSRPLDVAFVRY